MIPAFETWFARCPSILIMTVSASNKSRIINIGTLRTENQVYHFFTSQHRAVKFYWFANIPDPVYICLIDKLFKWFVTTIIDCDLNMNAIVQEITFDLSLDANKINSQVLAIFENCVIIIFMWKNNYKLEKIVSFFK